MIVRVTWPGAALLGQIGPFQDACHDLRSERHAGKGATGTSSCREKQTRRHGHRPGTEPEKPPRGRRPGEEHQLRFFFSRATWGRGSAGNDVASQTLRREGRRDSQRPGAGSARRQSLRVGPGETRHDSLGAAQPSRAFKTRPPKPQRRSTLKF